MILTLQKTKNALPSLKPPTEIALKGGVVYKITCPGCSSCYVGQTTRHLLNRVREHKRSGTPVGNHFRGCNKELTMDDVTIIASSTKSVYHLMTLEAILINTIKPIINKKMSTGVAP